MPSIFQEATEPHYATVGRIAATWAGFEQVIQMQIWTFGQIDYQRGACITSQIGNSGRLLDCLIALLALSDAKESQLKALKIFAEKVGKLQRRRNRIVHDPWFFQFYENGPPTTSRLEMSAAKKLVYELSEEPTETLRKFLGQIDGLVGELDSILSQ